MCPFCYIGKREFESALANSTEAEIQSAALLGIGRTRTQAGDYEGATRSFKEAVILDPSSAPAKLPVLSRRPWRGPPTAPPPPCAWTAP